VRKPKVLLSFEGEDGRMLCQVLVIGQVLWGTMYQSRFERLQFLKPPALPGDSYWIDSNVCFV
jgi:hypothetical protein